MREKLFHRDFTLVVIGQIISLLGNAVLRFVLPLYLLDVTGSRSLFGLCSAAAFVPMVVLTPLGGVAADWQGWCSMAGRRWTIRFTLYGVRTA